MFIDCTAKYKIIANTNDHIKIEHQNNGYRYRIKIIISIECVPVSGG